MRPAAFLRPPAFLRAVFLRVVFLRVVFLRAAVLRVALRRVVALRVAFLRGAAFFAARFGAAFFVRLTAIMYGVILSLANEQPGLLPMLYSNTGVVASFGDIDGSDGCV